jgi:hypothetical protein
MANYIPNESRRDESDICAKGQNYAQLVGVK